MISLLFSLFLLIYFIVIGRALLCLIGINGSNFSAWMLSPAIGISIQVLIVGTLNQAGTPVSSFAIQDAVITTVIGFMILGWKRPSLKWQIYTPVAALLLFSLIYSGWPALVTGFNWLSFANDDMANYCLAAMRHLNNGFYRVPTIKELTGTDYSQFYWFMHVGCLIRYGSEILLAWAAAISGKAPLHVFMPVIVTLATSMLAATAALARASRLSYKTTLWAMAILALSPLFLLGTFYQLIAQVAGLTLMCALAALTLAHRYPARFGGRVRYALGSGVLSAALCVTYPEVTPFLGLAIIGYPAIYNFRFGYLPRNWFFFMGATMVFTLIFIRENILVYIATILTQSQSGTNATIVENILFPYYLLPSGLPAIFGFSNLNAHLHGVSGAFYVITGAIGVVLLVAGFGRDAVRQKPYAVVGLVMAITGFYLFYNTSDFGLFKIAMFAQPFIALCIADKLSCLNRSVGRIIILVIIGLQLPTTIYYGTSSLGAQSGGFSSLPCVSQSVTIHEIGANNQPAICELSHVVAEKIVAMNMIGRELTYSAKNPFTNIYLKNTAPVIDKIMPIIQFIHPHAKEIISASSLFTSSPLNSKKIEALGSTFSEGSVPLIITSSQHITAGCALDILNGWKQDSAPHNNYYFTVINPDDTGPYLSFINSSEGHHFYLPESLQKISVFQLEPDYFSAGRNYAAVGRYFLFKIVGNESSYYMRISLTRSVMGEGRTKLPEGATIRGGGVTPACLTGAGAANVIIGPIQPLIINGQSLVALDFGVDGTRFPNNKQGVMKLYNEKIHLDFRRIIGFGRDISILSVRDYNELQRPSEINNPISELVSVKSLEYSGWFEDGWISKSAFVVLRQPQNEEELIIKGLIPGVGEFMRKKQKLKIDLNGRSFSVHSIDCGEFTINVPIPGNIMVDSKPLRISLYFETEQILSAPDNRPIAALIHYIGLRKQ